MFDRVFHPAGLAALTVLALSPMALQARTFTVTQTGDTNDGLCDRSCSLREAIMAANQRPGLDVIVLPRGVFKLTLAGADEDLGATGDLDVTGDLALIGRDPRRSIIDGGGIDRVLDIHEPASVIIANATVRNGVAAGPSPAPGGGIRNQGRLGLFASIVSGNSAPGFGGAIYSDGAGSVLDLNGSTISGNTAGSGGGGVAAGGFLGVVNSTFSGNRSLDGFGGGLYLFSAAQAAPINSVTITGNTSTRGGGGLYVEVPSASRTPVLSNSIVAGNSAPRDADCLGVDLSGGHNLIGQGEGCPGFSATLEDLTGTAAAPLDPRLDPLGDNGGPTPTHALLAGSPAVDAGRPAASGENACARFDQRGVRRHRTDCDIGAFERKTP
jgi:CSLREA domain-containing protein